MGSVSRDGVFQAHLCFKRMALEGHIGMRPGCQVDGARGPLDLGIAPKPRAATGCPVAAKIPKKMDHGMSGSCNGNAIFCSSSG